MLGLRISRYMKRKKYEELTFCDDFMFCKVLENNLELCKELLQLLLNIPIKQVVNVSKQKSIDITADAKSVRLDVYLEDTERSVYDVEMQTSVTKELPRRSRYYQGMLDLNQIDKGAKYSDLKRCYIVFICMEDPFGQGFPVYTFENRCKENQKLLLGDETVKVFVNARGNTEGISEELKAFLEYLKGGKVKENSFAACIDEDVKFAREHLEWRLEYMTLQMHYDEIAEEARAEGMAQGRAEGRADIIKQMLVNGMSVERIAECCRIPEDEIKKVAEMMKSIQ